MKIRPIILCVLLLSSLALMGCQESLKLPQTGKATQELPKKTLNKMAEKNMDKFAPITVRVFKEENIVEVWKQTRKGTYALLTTYDICTWSGKLGPKYVEGDRQAPEGFYYIRKGQMNPNSNYYLAFNIGFPNAYDQANGRTGQNLMVHGACSSAGCYSMTDENIAQIYALGRDAFLGGQREFLLQAFPFRMTAENMARYKEDPNYDFWKMLKEGYDLFEITKQPPRVDVCGKVYVFTPNSESQNLSAQSICSEKKYSKALESAYFSYQKAYEKAFNAALEKKSKETAPTIYGKKEAELVAKWSLDRASGIRVSNEPPSLPRENSSENLGKNQDNRNESTINDANNSNIMLQTVPIPLMKP